MGQEVGVTPLQMAVAYSVIANGGNWVKPHVVSERRSPDGSVLYRAQPELRPALKPETVEKLRNMMEGVTLRGTAKLAQVEGYSAAGKTGTAQKIDPKTRAYSSTKFIGSFVGFAPVSNPQVVIIVVIDEPRGAYHGGDVAAPVFREIAEQILPELNITPDVETKGGSALIAESHKPSPQEIQQAIQNEQQREATLPQVAAKSFRGRRSEIVLAVASQRAPLMPDLRGQSVRDVARTCSQLGLKLEAKGEGRALRQSPAAGQEVGSGQTVRVEFGRGN
jgi:cell division protein FtsI (penicillin-binding protein 3)